MSHGVAALALLKFVILTLLSSIASCGLKRRRVPANPIAWSDLASPCELRGAGGRIRFARGRERMLTWAIMYSGMGESLLL